MRTLDTISSQTILFYGTEQFGAAMLQALINADRWHIIGVVTQCDRPAGRRNEMRQSAVKQLAERHAIPIFQPENLKTIDFSLEGLPLSDLQVVCQYGIIMPKRIVEAPAFGTLNVHTSLLPAYRGASPIQTAILQGESTTGITIMCMDEKMDHGNILAQETIEISPLDTTPTLSQKMIPCAQKLLVTTIIHWFDRTIISHEQEHAAATFCRQFEKKDGLIDFSLSATSLYNRFRAFVPWPGTFAIWNGTILKLLDLQKVPPGLSLPHLMPGKIYVHNQRIFLGTLSEPLEIIVLQREGGKSLAARDFLLGARNFDGAQLEGKQKEGAKAPSMTDQIHRTSA